MDAVIADYYSDIPSMLCADGAVMAEGNGAARSRLPSLFEGTSLYSFMRPDDVLSFETAYEHSVRIRYDFPLSGCGAFTCARAAFEHLMGRRFSVVWLFEGEAARAAFDRQCAGTFVRAGQTESFLETLAGIDKALFPAAEAEGLFDLKRVTERLVRDMNTRCDRLDLAFTYTENDAAARAPLLPSATGLGGYVRVVLAMAHLLSDLAVRRACSVQLCRYGAENELRVTAGHCRADAVFSDVDGLCRSVPGSAPKARLCDCLAHLAGGAFSARGAGGSVTLMYTDGGVSPESVDFKSRDFFAFYPELFDRTARRMDAFSFLCQQEQAE